MEQQYLQPTTYIKTIENLSNTISNLHIENAVLKAQYEELSEYVIKLQKEQEEIINE